MKRFGVEPGAGDVNAETNVLIQGLVGKFEGHSVSTQIFTFGKRGSAGFSLQQFRAELGQTKIGGQEVVGSYKHVGPLGALNFGFASLPPVGIDMKAVQRIRRFQFPSNLPFLWRRCPHKIEFGVDSLDHDPLQHVGAWYDLGPPEEPFACLMVAGALAFSDNNDCYGAGANHIGLCLAWLRTLLAASYQWKVVALGFDHFIVGRTQGRRLAHGQRT